MDYSKALYKTLIKSLTEDFDSWSIVDVFTMRHPSISPHQLWIATLGPFICDNFGYEVWDGFNFIQKWKLNRLIKRMKAKKLNDTLIRKLNEKLNGEEVK